MHADVAQYAVLAAGAAAFVFMMWRQRAGAGVARRLIASGEALVVDVREKDEWNAGHLPSARHVPVGQIAARTSDIARWADGDKKKPIVVYCRAGSRAARAKAVLEGAGFEKVVNGGGYTSLV